jgi:hypothetical protein
MSCAREPGACWRIRCQLGKRCIESLGAEAQPAAQPVAPTDGAPALTDEQWSAIRDRVNEYAMWVTDAANHQSASMADIAHAAALSTLQKIRRAIDGVLVDIAKGGRQ